MAGSLGDRVAGEARESMTSFRGVSTLPVPLSPLTGQRGSVPRRARSSAATTCGCSP
jgi:hypothetical protein